ncbi:MAG: MMPL family transporter [Isosphaeraceae bacterium]
MVLEGIRRLSSERPGLVVAAWLGIAVLVGVLSPDLTRLAAEGQARMLAGGAESRLAAEVVRQCWPDQSYESMIVAVLYRPSGLTEADRQYIARLARRLDTPAHPGEVLRVIGPESAREIADRLVSPDGTLALVAVSLSTSFVAPATHRVVSWARDQTAAEPGRPAGLDLRWTGDAVIGRDYMAAVKTSLDRAALATIVLLLIVLMVVYRSFWLSLVPLVTIGISVVIARGLLAWMILAGWEVSSLVELFLIAILFGTGTDFCLFLSWRFAEQLDRSGADPVVAMRRTLGRSFHALATSAGTIIVGLMLMGTTRFKLFSSTGPSVAMGLVLALLATLSLTPSLLILLARARPGTFAGLANRSTAYWHRLGSAAMARPVRSWLLTFAAMVPLSILGLRSGFIQDLLTEMPAGTQSVEDFRLVASKFKPGMLAPLTVVLESNTDFRKSEGLALIDDVSRLLAHQRRLTEVRSATQPLGSPEPLSRARLSARLGEVNAGFHQLSQGADQLSRGLTEGAAKLRAVIWLEEATGLSLTGTKPKPAEALIPKADSSLKRAGAGAGSGAGTHAPSRGAEALATGLKQASAVLQWSQGMPTSWNLAALHGAFEALSPDSSAKPSGSKPSAAMPGRTAPVPSPLPAPQDRPAAPSAGQAKPKTETPPEVLLRELTRAAEGATQIAEGARRANREVTTILNDPVGRHALDRLLINDQTIHEHPELLRSFAAYITPDGHRARIDVTQSDRIFSNDAMNQVLELRRRIHDYLGEYEGVHVTAKLAGANAESADIRDLTRADQVQSWFIVPIGVILVLFVALRDPLACLNLVGTMILTYAFALGTTHLVFVNILGAQGLDWKVPYFLFVLLIAVGVDYNVFLMTRLNEESRKRGLRRGIVRAIGHTGGLISSAAAITATSFASFLISPLGSLRQLGFALVVGILIDATLVRPLLVPCGHWLLCRTRELFSPRIVVKKGQRTYVVVPD